MPDGSGKILVVKNDHCYALGFIAASGAFGHASRLGPDQRVRCVLLIDRQDARANFWGLGNMRIREMMKMTGLEPQSTGPDKHLLLDAADVLAYSAATSWSDAPARNRAICERIMSIARPDFGHYWWSPNGDIPERVRRQRDSL